MRVVDTVIAVGWIVFWIYWLAKSVGVKTGQTRWGAFAGFRLAILIVIIALLRTGVLKTHGTNTGNPVRLGVGLAMFLAGLALAVWARVYLGRNWGMPMTQKDNPELITTGPYRRVRHPIYTGIILAMIGTTIAITVFWLIAVALLGGYFIYSAFMEERFMAQTFPDSYPGYKRSTKMLIPFIF